VVGVAGEAQEVPARRRRGGQYGRAGAARSEPWAVGRRPGRIRFQSHFLAAVDKQALASYSGRPQEAEPPALATDLEPPLPTWRRRAGYVALGSAVAATLVAGELAVSAGQLSREARDARTTSADKAFDRRLDDRLRGVEVALGVAGASALSDGLLLWPRSAVQATPVWVRVIPE
jgi:hypothetical protein